MSARKILTEIYNILVVAFRHFIAMALVLIIAVVGLALVILLVTTFGGGCMTPRPMMMKNIVIRSGPEISFDSQLHRVIVIPGPLIMLEATDGGAPLDAR